MNELSACVIVHVLSFRGVRATADHSDDENCIMGTARVSGQTDYTFPLMETLNRNVLSSSVVSCLTTAILWIYRTMGSSIGTLLVKIKIHLLSVSIE